MYGTVALKYFNVINGITVGNITLDATTGNATVTNLAVTGNANLTAAANVALGSNSNVKLTGGSSGQYLQTDGAGNLSWQSISSATAIANGTSNVSIPAANGNVVVSVNGVANIATFTSNAVFRGSYGLTGIISQSNTAPASPQNGDQWYNTFNGILFEYLDDGTSSQWVDISSLPLPNIAGSNAAAVLNNVQSTGTYFPAFISSTANGNYQLNSNTAFSANLANGALIATTFVGALSGAATSATTAGTVTTAAQPNITSVGTLSSLTATGNVTGGNLTTGGALSVTGNVKTGPVVGVNTTANAWASANVVQIGSASFWNFSGDINTYLSQNYFFDGTNNKYIQNGAAADYSMQGGAHQWTNAPTGTAGANVTLTTRMALDANGNLTTSGTVAATGNVSGGNLTTGGALSVTGNANVGNIGAAAGVFTTVAGSLTTAAQPNITSTGTLTSLAVTGNVSAGNVSATTFTGALTGNATGSAATVTTAAQPNITSVGTLTSLAVTGNISAGNVSATTFTGALSGAATTAGTVTTAAQPNITSVGTLTSATVAGNVAAGNLTTTGVLSVTGTGVSSIAGNLDMTSNTIINLATPTNSTDAATKQYVDDVAQGLHTHDSCNAATQTTLASISGGTVTYNNGASGVGANLTTTGTFTTIDGVTLSNGMRILVKNEANAAHNGIYDRTSTTVLTRSTDFDTPAEMAGGDFTFVTAGTLYDNTGWVMTDPVTTVGTTNVVWVQFSGAGTYTAGTGLTLTGSQFSVNASQTQVTAVGTLTGLNSSGTITAPAFTANTGIFTGNGSGLSAIAGANVTGAVSFATTANAVAGANVSGTVANATFATSAGSATTAGTVTTAAQPNITSVSTSFSGLTFVANAQITMSGAGSQISGVNLVSANSFSGNGSSITGINATSIASGTLAQARLANSTITFGNTTLTLGGTTTTVAGLSSVTSTTFVGALTGAATSATTAGTVTTAAQPNITSVGTLTSLAVTGNVTADIFLSGNNGNGTNFRIGDDAWIGDVNAADTISIRGQQNAANGYIVFGNADSTTKLGRAGAGALTYNGTFNPTTLQTTAITAGSNVTAGTVTGNWTLTAGSRWQATYADLAEKYTADDTYEPGTVLLFGGEQEVTLANAFDSTKVAGVVTTNPAYSMNAMLEAEYVAEIALQGRVPCKVIGPIEKGDLMVSASNGHATANNEARAGTIIGKALENFNGDFGVIEVAVGRF
jgi:hypothetical protein